MEPTGARQRELEIILKGLLPEVDVKQAAADDDDDDGDYLCR